LTSVEYYLINHLLAAILSWQFTLMIFIWM
jgi:hypothetical protein